MTSKLIAPAILLLTLMATVTATEQPAQERFSFSFKTPVAKEPRLKIFNLGTKTTAKTTDDGLTLSLASDHAFAVTFGVQPKLSLKGDFEITLAYDNFKADDPLPQYGAGVNITIELDKDPGVGAAVGRNRRPEGDRFGVTDIKTKADGKKAFNPSLNPALHPSGQLRLVRKGDRISMLTADGEGAEFIQYRESASGTEDVVVVQFQCYSTGAGGAVSVRLKEVTIVADKIVGLGSAPSIVAAPSSVQSDEAPPVEKPRNRTMLWVAGGGIVLIAILLTVILLRRKGRANVASE